MLETNKIICASWIGRFGNRCHSYLYGKHIEHKFNQKFYVGAEWDGGVLFKNPAPVVSDDFKKIVLYMQVVHGEVQIFKQIKTK